MNSRYEQVVKRAFQYLDLAGYEMDAKAARAVLQIVDAELEQGEDALLPRVLDRLAQRTDPTPDGIPRAAPPLCRGSVNHT